MGSTGSVRATGRRPLGAAVAALSVAVSVALSVLAAPAGLTTVASAAPLPAPGPGDCRPVMLFGVAGNAGDVLGAVTGPMTQRLGDRLGVVAAPAPPAGTSYAVAQQEAVGTLSTSVNDVAARCAESRILFLGYSEGAHVVGDFASRVGTGQERGIPAERVLAVALVGDPARSPFTRTVPETAAGQGVLAPRAAGFGALDPRTVEVCAPGDPVCDSPAGTPFPALDEALRAPPHASYAELSVARSLTATQWVADALSQVAQAAADQPAPDQPDQPDQPAPDRGAAPATAVAAPASPTSTTTSAAPPGTTTSAAPSTSPSLPAAGTTAPNTTAPNTTAANTTVPDTAAAATTTTTAAPAPATSGSAVTSSGAAPSSSAPPSPAGSSAPPTSSSAPTSASSSATSGSAVAASGAAASSSSSTGTSATGTSATGTSSTGTSSAAPSSGAAGAVDTVFSLAGVEGFDLGQGGNVEDGEVPEAAPSPNVAGHEAVKMALPAGGKRSEVRPEDAAQDIRAGERLFFGYSAFLPEDFPTDADGFQVVWQLHDGETNTSPPVALEIQQGRLWLANVGELVEDLGPVSPGENVTVHMDIEFAVGGGAISLWRNGEQRLDRFRPPRGTMIDGFDFLKTGIYRDEQGAPASTLFLNDLKVGDSLESVAQLAGATGPVPVAP